MDFSKNFTKLQSLVEIREKSHYPDFCFSMPTNLSLQNSTIWNATVFENDTILVDPEIKLTKEIVYKIFLPLFLSIGIPGNILNLITLESPSLQTVPFMYIRSIAIFDLIGLSIVSLYIILRSAQPNLPKFFVAYMAHFELTILNAFLAASLYAAVILTIERYLLICQPHRRFTGKWNPIIVARIKISIAFFAAFLLHLPMVVQSDLIEKESNGTISYDTMTSRIAHCPETEPFPTIYYYYERGREAVRIICVLVMTVVNIIITRQLQLAKQRRRRMTLKTVTGSGGKKGGTAKRKNTSNTSSFTEKKLTVMMIGITVIYLVGNIPQALMMTLDRDQLRDQLWFEIFRGVSNLCEVLNHCLNFYVFCITSKEYSQTFLSHCLCFKRVLETVLCRQFDLRRTGNETDSTTFGMDSPGTLREDSKLIMGETGLVYL